MFNIDTNTTITGPSLSYGHFTAPTIVNNYNIIPFLYVFGGDTIYIERLNSNELNEWETISILTNIDGSTIDYSVTRVMVCNIMFNINCNIIYNYSIYFNRIQYHLKNIFF